VRSGRARGGPSFIFMGPSRAGSSWFFETLRQHPGVYVPLNKGSFFFTRFHEMGFGWYEGFFQSRREGQIPGEVCEDYLSSPVALRRIADYRPDMRLICCLRNPYERAFSAWRFCCRNGVGKATVAQQCESTPELFNEGCYGTHLRALRAIFPAHQIRIFFFEELTAAPDRVAWDLYRFIGANPAFVPQSLRQRVNVNGTPRSRLLARIVHDLHTRSWGRSRTLSSVVGAIKQVRPLRRLLRAALYDERHLADEWAAHAAEFPDHVTSRYEQEISLLEELLGRDLAAWRLPGMQEASSRQGAALASGAGR
jgi:Sulfotransferase domain